MDNKTLKALVDRLADKTLSFGCRAEDRHGCQWMLITGGWAKISGTWSEHGRAFHPETILGHPILIGTVLEKMYPKSEKSGLRKVAGYGYQTRENEHKLLTLWQPCGFTKSLQEIVEESGWEEVAECECGENYIDDIMPKTCLVMHDKKDYTRLKSPQARALVDFLASIFLTDKER